MSEQAKLTTEKTEESTEDDNTEDVHEYTYDLITDVFMKGKDVNEEIENKLDEMNKNGYVKLNTTEITNPNGFKNQNGYSAKKIDNWNDILNNIHNNIISEEIDVIIEDNEIILDYETKTHNVTVYIKEIRNTDKEVREFIVNDIEDELVSITKVQNVEFEEIGVKYLNDMEYEDITYTIELKSEPIYLDDNYEIDYHIGHEVTSKIRSILNEYDMFIDDYNYRTPEKATGQYSVGYTNNEVTLQVDL